ncbi:MAG: ABC transporter substrate-binding protein [Pseudomonadota bacterium]
MVKNYILALSFSILALLTGACSDKEKKENSLVVAVSADNPPYEFIQDGKIVGLDIDVINAVGRALDTKIIIKNLDFPGLFPALSSNNVDLVISAISVTPAREEYFNFSDVYAKSSIGLLYKDDNIKSVADLAGKKIGAPLGTTWEQAAKEIAAKMPGTMVRSLSNNLVLVEELKSGSIDAFITESAQIEKFIHYNPELKSLPLPEYTSEFAIVLPKNSALTESINKALETLRSEGELDVITKHWLK